MSDERQTLAGAAEAATTVATAVAVSRDDALAMAEARARAAEARAEDLQERLDALTQAAAQINWHLPADGCADDLPRWRAYTGQTSEQVRGQGWLDAIHPAHRGLVQQVWAQALAAGTVCVAECHLLRHDGIYRAVLLRLVPVADADGRRRAWDGLCVDNTERQHFERRTREAVEGLLATAEALIQPPTPAQPGAAADETVNVAGLRLAELARTLLGCQRVTLLRVEAESERLWPIAVTGDPPQPADEWSARFAGSALGDYLDAPDLERLRANECVVLDLARPSYAELRTHSGAARILVVPVAVEERAVAVLTADHGDAEHIFTLDELTLAETIGKLAGLVIERERLIREREQARASALALEHANRRMDNFMSIASHELRTPMTSAKVNVQFAERQIASLLRDGLDAFDAEPRLARVRELLVRTSRQMDRQNRLVGDLLDMSRIQMGKLELRLGHCDLVTIVRESVEEQRLGYPRRTIALMTPRRAMQITADADRIAQVVTNYLTNALKYAPEDRPIAVSIRREDGIVRVRVRDAGPGLPPAEQARIWDRFHRAKDVPVVSGSGVGLGLGLYISREIVENHGGQVGVQSRPGGGCVFWFSLPADDREVADTQSRRGGAAEGAGG